MLKIIESKFRSEELERIYNEEKEKRPTDKTHKIEKVSLFFKWFNLVSVTALTEALLFYTCYESGTIPITLCGVLSVSATSVVAIALRAALWETSIIEEAVEKRYKKKGIDISNPAQAFWFYARVLRAGEHIAEILNTNTYLYEYRNGCFITYEADDREILTKNKLSVPFNHRLETDSNTLDFSHFDKEIDEILAKLNRKDD